MKTEKQKVKEQIDGFLNKYTEKKIFGWKPEFDKYDISKKKEVRESYIQDARIPTFCPKCEIAMKGSIDTKMYWLHKMCLNCVSEKETQLRIDGKWEEYERTKIKENIRSYIKDTSEQVDEYCDKILNGTTIVNVINEELASIDYEKWKLPSGDANAHVEKARNTLQMMYDDFEREFGEKV